MISQHKTLKQYRENSSSALNKQGLKSLSKQSRERLEAYQHLFYLLQTNPGNYIYICLLWLCTIFVWYNLSTEMIQQHTWNFGPFSLQYILPRLIFEMPQSRTTKFMETVILTLYNYASNHREEYLLLKLFKTALKEEIRWGVDHLRLVLWYH